MKRAVILNKRDLARFVYTFIRFRVNRKCYFFRGFNTYVILIKKLKNI